MAAKHHAARSRRHRETGGGAWRTRLLLFILGVVAVTAIVTFALPRWRQGSTSPGGERAVHASPPSSWQRLRVKVLAVHPHDPRAFTQGLLWYRGKLYESTGLYGRSTLREVDPESGRVERETALPARVFGEGLARVGERLVQLSWQRRQAFVWRLASFDRLQTFTYRGEGWGLCYDGSRLVMSNGSASLTFRDPRTFARLGRVAVSLAGKPLASLNELECVDGKVYANVWQTQIIVRIDPATGVVDEEIDASGLLTPDEQRSADVLNGIAYDPETRHFWITGKLWPKMFEVEWVPAS